MTVASLNKFSFSKEKDEKLTNEEYDVRIFINTETLHFSVIDSQLTFWVNNSNEFGLAIVRYKPGFSAPRSLLNEMEKDDLFYLNQGVVYIDRENLDKLEIGKDVSKLIELKKESEMYQKMNTYIKKWQNVFKEYYK